MASRFGTRSNGEEYLDTRRNKYNMQEAVRKAGLRAARQRLCFTEEDVKEFYNSLRHGNDQGGTMNDVELLWSHYFM